MSFLVMLKARPEQESELATVETDSRQRLRRERPECGGEACQAGLQNGGRLRRGEVEIHIGQACGNKDPLGAAFLRLWNDTPIPWHVGKKSPPFTVFRLLALL